MHLRKLSQSCVPPCRWSGRRCWPAISPNLEAEIRRLEAGGARLLHLDIMDGHFVPNLSFGFPVVEAVRRVTRLPLDVHLMISEPGRYVERFRQAGADLMTIHIEAVPDPRPLLARSGGWGRRPG